MQLKKTDQESARLSNRPGQATFRMAPTMSGPKHCHAEAILQLATLNVELPSFRSR